MPVQTYTVHEPRPAPDSIPQRAKSLVFVKEGFSISAFLLGPLWLLPNCRRLVSFSYALDGAFQFWTGSVGIAAYLAALIGIPFVFIVAGLPMDAMVWAYIALQLIIGFEARDLYRADLEARGYMLRAVVTGHRLEECELRYLREWLPDARLDRARLNAELTASGGTDKRNYKEPVIGMFPAHGG